MSAGLLYFNLVTSKAHEMGLCVFFTPDFTDSHDVSAKSGLSRRYVISEHKRKEHICYEIAVYLKTTKYLS